MNTRDADTGFGSFRGIDSALPDDCGSFEYVVGVDLGNVWPPHMATRTVASTGFITPLNFQSTIGWLYSEGDRA